jgi:formimidoylglutamate deiminase
VHPRSYHAALAVLDGRLRADVRIDVDEHGTIVGFGSDADPVVIARDFGPALLLPGLVDAHSHAFQRAIRGATQRRAAHDPSSFWSWREAMYAAATGLDPEALFEITRLCFAEMLRSGITCVGEFHYVHHQADGTPYADPNELSWQVVRAAQEVGIRLVLLEVFYDRAGAGKPPLPEQRRFCDGSVDAYLRRVDALRARGVAVGIAPHSIRAVGRPAMAELAAYAHANSLPLHAHVSEQPRENDECMAEHGMTPTAVFAEAGALDRERGFTAVHAVHVTDDDRRHLAAQSVCACPTTEADLGDGIVGAAELRARGTNLALGSDANAIVDLVQEARLLEMGERLRSRERLRLADQAGELGLALLDIATRGGATSLGVADTLGTLEVGRPFDAVVVDLQHPFFAAIARDRILDALFTAGTAAPVRQVIVGGVERL